MVEISPLSGIPLTWILVAIQPGFQNQDECLCFHDSMLGAMAPRFASECNTYQPLGGLFLWTGPFARMLFQAKVGTAFRL